MNSEKIELEIVKIEKKISELQTKLKDLKIKKEEQENLELIKEVKMLNLKPKEVIAFLKQKEIDRKEAYIEDEEIDDKGMERGQ